MPNQIPNLLYADSNGNIIDDDDLFMSGRSGFDAVAMDIADFIELPEGSDVYMLPNRHPIGFNKETGEPTICEKGFAVAAQMAPAHSQFYISSYVKDADAETLPLFAYTAVGWLNGKFYVPAIRIDADIRQEPKNFDQTLVAENVARLTKKFPDNRLLDHIGNNCALNYHCPAARNFFLNRYEAPIPTSPACNSNCIGCISFQPEKESITSTQDRLTFKPTAKEIAEYTIEHLNTAPNPIISFGQGCEGEPLLMWETIRDAIREIRKKTSKGSININTNGSMPHAVEELCKAGLNSIRVSTNSVRKKIYDPYYLPNNYSFDALAESVKVVRKYNGWASLNYFVFPGMSDAVEEYEALRKFIRETNLSMIQWRNFNIDPDWYLQKIGVTETGECLGMKKVLQLIKEEFPHITYGYFNPGIDLIKSKLKEAVND
ncbi:MAG: radical SAM protein [Chitinophagales bacterium]|nr:radical SAM protein [Chitinophagales bacterium]